MIKTRYGLVVLAAAMAFPLQAQAGSAWLRASASSCVQLDSGQPPVSSPGGWSFQDGTTGSTNDEVLCPYQDQNQLRRDQLETLNVYLYDASANGEPEVQLCRRSYTSSSGTCGEAEGTGPHFTGYRTVGIESGLDDVAWQNTTGVAYIHTSHSGSGNYRFRGYYARNNTSATPKRTFRGQASLCTPESSGDFHDLIFSGLNTSSFADGYFDAGDPNGGTGLNLVCSYPERNGLQRDDLSTLRVYASDRSGSDTVSVQLCRRSYVAGSGDCGAVEEDDSANITFTETELDDSAWQNTSGTAYMNVHLPEVSSIGQRSEFRGFYMESL